MGATRTVITTDPRVAGVDTVAALRALDADHQRDSVRTKGGAVAGDGLGRLYYWSATSTATDDGSSDTGVVKPTALGSGDPGRWLELADRPWDVTGSVADLAALRAVYAGNVATGDSAYVAAEDATYYWDAASTATDSAFDVKPTAISSGSPGRWEREDGSTGRSLDTLTALRALSSSATIPAGQIRYVKGRVAIADGGEGHWRYDSADTTSADNFGTIAVDAAGRRWKRLGADDEWQAVWFGAKTAATINLASLALNLVGGGALKLSGTWTYAVSVAARSNVEIAGEGRSTLLDAAAAVSAVTIGAVSDFTLRNLRIDGHRGTYVNPGVHGVYADASIGGYSRIRLEQLWIENPPSCGILMQANSAAHGDTVDIVDVQASNCGWHGIICQDYVDFASMDRCVVEGYGLGYADGVGITNGRTAYAPRVTNFRVDGTGSTGTQGHGVSMDNTVGRCVCGPGVVANTSGYGVEIGIVNDGWFGGIVAENTLRAGLAISGTHAFSTSRSVGLTIDGIEVRNGSAEGVYLFQNFPAYGEMQYSIRHSRIEMTNIVVRSCAGIGLYANHAHHWSLDGFTATDCGLSGLYVNPSCDNWRIDNLTLVGNNTAKNASHAGYRLSLPTSRLNSTAYGLLIFVVVSGKLYEATVAGTTGASVPSVMGTTNVGDTVVDGAGTPVTWTDRGPGLRPGVRANSTPYAVGASVIGGGRLYHVKSGNAGTTAVSQPGTFGTTTTGGTVLDNTVTWTDVGTPYFAFGNLILQNGRVYEVTTAGTLANTPPTFPGSPAILDTVTDGTAVWTDRGAQWGTAKNVSLGRNVRVLNNGIADRQFYEGSSRIDGRFAVNDASPTVALDDSFFTQNATAVSLFALDDMVDGARKTIRVKDTSGGVDIASGLPSFTTFFASGSFVTEGGVNWNAPQGSRITFVRNGGITWETDRKPSTIRFASTLTTTAAVAVPANDYEVFVYTLSGTNMGTLTISGGYAGKLIELQIVQDATPPRTYTLPSSMKFPGGAGPAHGTVANSRDIYRMRFDGTNWHVVASAIAVV